MQYARDMNPFHVTYRLMAMKKLSKHIVKDRRRRLLLLIKDQWRRLFWALICMLVMAGVKSVIPFLIKSVVDDIFINNDVSMLKLIPFAVLALYLLLGLSMYFQVYVMSYVG